MPILNLEAKNKTQEIIKEYLEKNVNETLADKINNGVRIQKDEKTLINKKTLSECMDFALKEAQKLTEKGARTACIQDSVVFGWVIHFFEEDTIEGTLYNEDGTEYKPQNPVTASKTVTTYTPPAPKPKPQMSLFELMENSASEEKPFENAPVTKQLPETATNEEEATEIAENENADVEETLPVTAVQQQGSPFYQRYMQVQKKYPDHIVLFKRGDFYEALGKGALTFAENLALTLTGRDCGLLERIPMVGVPQHTIEIYLGKAVKKGLKIILTDSYGEVKEYPQKAVTLPDTDNTTSQKPILQTKEPALTQDFAIPDEDGKHWIDEHTYVDDDGEVHTVEEEPDDDTPAFDMSAYDAEALAILDEIFENLLELR